MDKNDIISIDHPFYANATAYISRYMSSDDFEVQYSHGRSLKSGRYLIRAMFPIMAGAETYTIYTFSAYDHVVTSPQNKMNLKVIITGKNFSISITERKFETLYQQNRRNYLTYSGDQQALEEGIINILMAWS